MYLTCCEGRSGKKRVLVIIRQWHRLRAVFPYGNARPGTALKAGAGLK
jgi:hypothetical protein